MREGAPYTNLQRHMHNILFLKKTLLQNSSQSQNNISYGFSNLFFDISFCNNKPPYISHKPSIPHLSFYTFHYYILLILEYSREVSTNSRFLLFLCHKSINIFPEYISYKLEPGDKILLCSDGLWDTVSEIDIQNILFPPKSLQDICADLINKANIEGGHDNITALVVHHEPKL